MEKKDGRSERREREKDKELKASLKKAKQLKNRLTFSWDGMGISTLGFYEISSSITMVELSLQNNRIRERLFLYLYFIIFLSF